MLCCKSSTLDNPHREAAMLKSFSWTAVLPIALFSLFDFPLFNVAVADVPSRAIAPASPLPSIDDALVCYMLTADGRTLNLNPLCGRGTAGPTPQRMTLSSTSLSPETNLGGLDVWGRGPDAPPCFGLDEQGRVCPPSRSE